MGFQAWLPLPLPRQLVVFGLGDWSCYSADTSIAVDVLVAPGIAPQRVGTLEPARRLQQELPRCPGKAFCFLLLLDSLAVTQKLLGPAGRPPRSLVWEDNWRTDIFMASLKEMDKGNPVRLVLTVNGKLLQGVSSSTPAHPFLIPETTQSPVLPVDDGPLGQNLEDPTGVKSQSSEVAARASRPVKKDVQPPLRTVVVPCALKSPAGKVESNEAWRKSPDQGPPRVHSKKPRKVLFEPTASERNLDEEDLAVKELQGSPSPRWCHAMCLSDLGTAVLIGGQGVNQQSCRDALWKLEIDSDLWLPVGFQLQSAMPSCLHGHTATYDPDTKRIYIFGGIREDKDYSSIYILDTVNWKWLLVAAKGRIPVLTYHSATIYHKELFVFGGTFPKKAPLAATPCSNVLYVFNPEHEIWYQPISEGEKPLPRLGHSATLLKNKLLIFGGQRTSLYLSDMHILDLGFMEYTPVPLLAGQPSARCFHAALAVSDQKVLISGGCNARGALHDAFVFHLDTLSWSTVIHHDLCSVPRAGHTLLDLTPPHLMDMDEENKEEQNLHTVLVFGGSNCAGTFYNSTVKIQLDLG
ncbi:PREDICTED: rab9 effector protein with kelch motifs-like isoform X1 [Ficedula albicollis]|uniref:rab9 effector protein with kelch motifs-like isoform X1 n=2 Tax=Ficedula albicollis TaxID=59894 RepID=UPI00035987B0|nr:PREDICTED: rab9 effector protein with kelch motifs-like isoform X1 [Ficedula albicollis]